MIKKTTVIIDVDSTAIDRFSAKLDRLRKDASVVLGAGVGGVAGPGAGAGGGGSGAGGGTGAAGAGGNRGLAQLLKTALPIGALSGAAYFVINALRRNYGMAKQYAAGKLGALPFTGQYQEAGTALGINPMQEMMLRQSFSQAAGFSATPDVLQAYRAYGINPGQIGGAMSIFAKGGGAAGGPEKAAGFLSQSIAAGMAQGLNAGHLPQFIAEVTGLIRQIGTTGVNVDAKSMLSAIKGIGGAGTAFTGKRAVGVMGAMMGAGQQMLAGGGDPLIYQLLMQQAGYGKGMTFSQANAAIEAMMANPAKYMTQIMAAVSNFPPEYQRLLLRRMGLSWTQAQQLVERGFEPGRITDAPIASEARRMMGIGGYGAIVAQEAGIQGERIKYGMKIAPTALLLQRRVFDLEKVALDVSIPMINKATSAAIDLFKGISVFREGVSEADKKKIIDTTVNQAKAIDDIVKQIPSTGQKGLVAKTAYDTFTKPMIDALTATLPAVLDMIIKTKPQIIIKDATIGGIDATINSNERE